MSSDASYTSFLEKANQLTGAHSAQSTSIPSKNIPAQKTHTTGTTSSSIPTQLTSLSATYYYTSDTDAPFTPTHLPYSSGSAPPSAAADFAKLVGARAEDVEVMSWGAFDPRDQHAEVREAMQDVSDGGVKVYRVQQRGGTRATYFVLGFRGESGGLVGFEVESVET